MRTSALAMGLVLFVFAVPVLLDATAQTVSATCGIGPATMPYVAAAALAALGVGHIVVAFEDGLPVPEHADRVAIGWIALGLVALLVPLKGSLRMTPEDWRRSWKAWLRGARSAFPSQPCRPAAPRCPSSGPRD